MIVIRSKKSVRQWSPTQTDGMCYPCIAPLHPRNAAAPQAPADEDEAAVPAGCLNYALYVLLRNVSNGFRMV